MEISKERIITFKYVALTIDMTVAWKYVFWECTIFPDLLTDRTVFGF